MNLLKKRGDVTPLIFYLPTRNRSVMVIYSGSSLRGPNTWFRPLYDDLSFEITLNPYFNFDSWVKKTEVRLTKQQGSLLLHDFSLARAYRK